jgi:hypothetical protein
MTRYRYNKLSNGIINKLKQLQAERFLLTTDLEASKENLPKFEQTTQASLENFARLVKHLSLLCGEQTILYKRSLTKWKRWTLGYAGLIAAYIAWNLIRRLHKWQ